MSEPSERFGGFTSTTELRGAGRDAGSPLKRIRSLFGSQSEAFFLVLVALAVFFSTLRPDAFSKIANIMNMATNASVLLVLGVGSTFVILTGGTDLFINGVLVFSGMIAAVAMVRRRRRRSGRAARRPCMCGRGGDCVGCDERLSRGKGKDSGSDRGLMGMSLGFALLLTRGVDISDVPESLVLTVGSGRVGGNRFL